MLRNIAEWLDEKLKYLSQLFNSKKIKKKNIQLVTTMLNQILYEDFKMHDGIDDKFRQHIIFVVNKILLIIQDYNLSTDELDKILHYIRRLYYVYKEYKDKKEGKNIDEIKDITREFQEWSEGKYSL